MSGSPPLTVRAETVSVYAGLGGGGKGPGAGGCVKEARGRTAGSNQGMRARSEPRMGCLF